MIRLLRATLQQQAKYSKVAKHYKAASSRYGLDGLDTKSIETAHKDIIHAKLLGKYGIPTVQWRDKNLVSSKATIKKIYYIAGLAYILRNKPAFLVRIENAWNHLSKYSINFETACRLSLAFFRGKKIDDKFKEHIVTIATAVTFVFATEHWEVYNAGSFDVVERVRDRATFVRLDSKTWKNVSWSVKRTKPKV
jgi:hypothetical protein